MTLWRRWDPTWLPPHRLDLFLEKETPMTLPAPAPAHPWIKTARTIVAGVTTAAVLLPLAINAADIDVTAEGWGWLVGVLAVLGAVTRVMAVPAINTALQKLLGLGSQDVEAGKVVALVSPAHLTVAGEAAAAPTGAILSPAATVRDLRPGE